MTRIILIGFMGSGKTTLGKALAKQLGLPFIDSDAMIEQICGMKISEIFESKGEDFFREKEKEIIESVAEFSDFVFSTGGGLPCVEGRMARLNRLGTTVYLKLSPESLYERLKNETENRPLLKEVDLLTFIKEKLSEREPYYSQATIIIEETDQNLECLTTLLNSLQKS